MVILGIVAVVLMLVIGIAAVVHLLDKYSKAKDEIERQRLSALRAAGDAARVASGQPPIPGSGVDRSEIRPLPPEPPPNRTSSGRLQNRQRPRARQNIESSFSDLFDSLGDQMTQAFRDVSQAVNSVAEHTSQFASASTSIARDAQTLLDLGFVGDMIALDQSRRSNLQHLSLVSGIRPQTIRALQELETSNRAAEHMNWGRLVQEFMRMIESGELTLDITTTEVTTRSRTPRVTTNPPETQRSSTQQSQPPTEKKEDLPPTRFEREDVI